MEDALLDWLSGAAVSDGVAPFDPNLPGMLSVQEDAMMVTGFDSFPDGNAPILEGAASAPVPTQFLDTSAANPVISQVQSMVIAQRSLLERLRRAQREAVTSSSVFAPASLPALAALTQQHQLIAEEVQRIVLALQGLRSQQLLSPGELALCQTLLDTISVHSAQLALFRAELEYIQSVVQAGPSAPVPALVSLVIARTPFPAIWMKRNQVADYESIQIQLLTATGVQLLEVAAIKPHLVCLNQGAAKKQKPPFDVDSIPIDPSTLSASVCPTFLCGTRNDVAQVRFTVQLRFAALYGGAVSANSVTLEAASAESAPFVILTNESQFAKAAEVLFHRDLFHYHWGRPASSVPWQLYANTLQLYFLRASRQQLSNSSRPLSASDLSYLHSSFFQLAAAIDVSVSQKLWEWLGVVLQRLRYQKHWLALYLCGLLYGFISREEAWNCLLPAPVGVALFRFSETSAGSLSMAFRVANPAQPIKNYLIKTEDITGLGKSLPDFILSRAEVQGLLQVCAFSAPGVPHFELVSKAALVHLSSPKSPSLATASPYDDL